MKKRWDQMTFSEKLESIREDGRAAAKRKEPDSNNPFSPDEGDFKFHERDEDWNLEPKSLRGRTFITSTAAASHDAWHEGWVEVAMAKGSKA
jgi:hypothetical protein